jgi:hypothetical protein
MRARLVVALLVPACTAIAYTAGAAESPTAVRSPLAYIDKGTLTYTVRTGSVSVYTGDAEDRPRLVRRIAAGHTAKIGRGQWLIEKPRVQHFGANRTGKPVVILAATLLENGKPPAIPVQQ